MDEYFIGLTSAFWLGILTSISPCPLATNIAAISFIGKNVSKPRMVFFTGILYTLGRTIAYLVLGALIVTSLLSAPFISFFLQNYMNKLLGPILILAGILLLELIHFRIPGLNLNGKFQKNAERWGIWGGFLLGIIFAVSFCPISAALFFGSLIPVAVKYNSSVLFPSLYGVGTGLPVFIFAILIAFGTRSLGNVFNKITQIEKWARRITGAIFIGVGIYYSLTQIFQI